MLHLPLLLNKTKTTIGIMMTITIMTITIIPTAIAMLQDTVKDVLVLLWLPP